MHCDIVVVKTAVRHVLSFAITTVRYTLSFLIYNAVRHALSFLITTFRHTLTFI